jgi:hypothetical protein
VFHITAKRCAIPPILYTWNDFKQYKIDYKCGKNGENRIIDLNCIPYQILSVTFEPKNQTRKKSIINASVWKPQL